MRKFIFYCICFLVGQVHAQSTVSGKVIDVKKQAIVGANVYILGTYDGATTNAEGEFRFTTSAQEGPVLVVSFLSYETKNITLKPSQFQNLKIILREDVQSLDTVVVSAGTFEANDNSKVSVLKPLDVVTTASALGDFVGALQTLPGTSNVAEDGRLFVRGGTPDETQVFIDGIRVFTPYSPSANNTPTRGRYSPFLFNGITFSTGGYASEYGQALSSVLLLNTINEPTHKKTDISLMSIGFGIGHTEKWEKSSLSFNTSYVNLAPYLKVFKDKNDWETPYVSAQGETVFRQQLDQGVLKVYAAFDTSKFQLQQDDINTEEGIDFKLNNQNFYLNTSYKGTLGKQWGITTGLSYTYAKDKIWINAQHIEDTEHAAHLKLKLKKRFNSRVKLNFGVEHFMTDFKERFQAESTFASYGYRNPITAGFAELDLIYSKDLALKVGLRSDYSGIFKTMEVAPRAAIAYKTSKNGQVSLAYGHFYQNPSRNILKFEQDLKSQKASHYILNYQYTNQGRIFRAEVYNKTYDHLVKYNTESPEYFSAFESSGEGYAQGLDLFWRDNTSVPQLDYWLSYSYLDTKREFNNYNTKVQPSYATTHNLSVVGKYWIASWKSQIGAAYSMASGRPYTNPNTSGILDQRTKGFHSLSLNWSYLLDQQKILYCSVNNVLNFKNVYGYQYADVPNPNGVYMSRALTPASNQFFFVGFFWTLSSDPNDNQLNTL